MHIDGQFLAVLVDAEHLRLHAEDETLLLQRSAESLGDFHVSTGGNRVGELDDGDLGAQSGPHRTHFEADDATSDEHQVFGHLAQLERARAGDDALLVDLETGQRNCVGTSSDQNVPVARDINYSARDITKTVHEQENQKKTKNHNLKSNWIGTSTCNVYDDLLSHKALVAASSQFDGDLGGADNFAVTFLVLDTVLLEQEFNARGETSDGLGLGLHHCGNVDARGVDYAEYY